MKLEIMLHILATIYIYVGLSICGLYLPGVGRSLSWLWHWVDDPGNRGTNPVTSLIFSCVAIYFRAVYNLQRHQRPLPLIQCIYGVGG